MTDYEAKDDYPELMNEAMNPGMENEKEDALILAFYIQATLRHSLIDGTGKNHPEYNNPEAVAMRAKLEMEQK